MTCPTCTYLVLVPRTSWPVAAEMFTNKISICANTNICSLLVLDRVFEKQLYGQRQSSSGSVQGTTATTANANSLSPGPSATNAQNSSNAAAGHSSCSSREASQEESTQQHTATTSKSSNSNVEPSTSSVSTVPYAKEKKKSKKLSREGTSSKEKGLKLFLKRSSEPSINGLPVNQVMFKCISEDGC